MVNRKKTIPPLALAIGLTGCGDSGGDVGSGDSGDDAGVMVAVQAFCMKLDSCTDEDIYDQCVYDQLNGSLVTNAPSSPGCAPVVASYFSCAAEAACPAPECTDEGVWNSLDEECASEGMQ